MITSAPPRVPNPSLTSREILSAWGRILTGHVPLVSIEITRECPLSCPWCYAYGESHLGGKVALRPLSDLRGDALVDDVLELPRNSSRERVRYAALCSMGRVGSPTVWLGA